MTVIVMLILAGVSLNALVGDNGIITNSMDAKTKNGMAILEEFLQQKYVENFENFNVDDTNKIAKLADLYQSYFYNPKDDHYGTVNYMLDSEGHALYLINKQGLPQEIKDNLTGGNCGVGKTGSERYYDYLSLNDVYGVTGNLKVYYSSGDGTFIGIASSDELDNDTTTRIVLEADSAITKSIKYDGTALTVADTQSIKSLEMDNPSGLENLKDLYVLGSLENLTLRNINLTNLDGIEMSLKLNYVYFDNCIISDYTSLSSVKNLTYLYFYNIDDDEFETVCEGIKDAKYDKLKYFGILGVTGYVATVNAETNTNQIAELIAGTRTASKHITTLLPFSMLGTDCVKNICYLDLHCNDIEDDVLENNGVSETRYALENIYKCTNLLYLRIDRNHITTLKGLENMTKLAYLFAGRNWLGKNEEYDAEAVVLDENEIDITTDFDRGKGTDNALYALSGKTSLFYVCLNGNVDLKWVSYLSGDMGIKSLYFGDGSNTSVNCVNMVDTEVASLRSVFANCGSWKSYPGKYWLSMLDENNQNLEVNLDGQTITEGQFETLGTYTNIKYLNLNKVKILSKVNSTSIITSQSDINTLANNVLKKIKNLKYLNVSSASGCSFENFNDITFIKGVRLDDNSDDIILKELSANATKLSTKKPVISGDVVTWEDYENGLKLLDAIRYNSTLVYGAEIVNLSVDEGHINFGSFSTTSKNVASRYPEPSYFWGSTKRGLWCTNVDAFNTIINISNLKNFAMANGGANGAFLDFSETSLENFSSGYSTIMFGMKFPPTLKSSYQCGGRDNSSSTKRGVDYSLCNSTLKTIDIHGASRVSVAYSLGTLPSGFVLEKLGLRFYNVIYDCTDLILFKNVYDIRGENLKIHEIYDNGGGSLVSTFTSLNGIQYVDDLETLNFNRNYFTNLSDVSYLSKFDSTLKTLYLPFDSIADVSFLSSFTALKTLDLRNNCLAVYVEKSGLKGLDANGNLVDVEKWYTLKEICARMKRNAGTGKVTLKLSGNTSITNWNDYTSNSAFWASDSTYGN